MFSFSFFTSIYSSFAPISLLQFGQKLLISANPGNPEEIE
jgi:hypothetical protein